MRSQTSCHFYPRPPRGGRRQSSFLGCSRFLFLSTPSARRATTCCRCGAACGAYFYPRPPRGGRRSAAGLEGQAGRFLSTPSARRATPMSRSICARRSKFLSTPSARRATLYNHRHAHCCQISIHALREEGDRRARAARAVAPLFLSTPSARRATWDGGRNHRR